MLHLVLGVILGLAAIAGTTVSAVFVPELAPTVAVAAFSLCTLYIFWRITSQAQADLRAVLRHNMALSDKGPAQAQAALEVQADMRVATDHAPSNSRNRVQRFAGE